MDYEVIVLPNVQKNCCLHKIALVFKSNYLEMQKQTSYIVNYQDDIDYIKTQKII